VKILFVCGGLETGRDGVGDYCRRLAAAGRERGWEPALLAIHDAHIPSREPMRATWSGIPMLRLSRREAWDVREQGAAEFIAGHRPEWVSLQFVGYALEPKGVIFRWVPRLTALLSGPRVHLMFHEIWVGASTEYGLRDRLLGAVQKLGIRRLARRLRPDAVHTSNHAYQRLLAGIGVRAGRLRLPGNIPVPLPDPGRAVGAPVRREDTWVAGVFGTIHPRWQPGPWLEELLDLAAQAGRRLEMVRFGESGAGGARVWAQLQSDFGDRLVLKNLGVRDADEITQLLSDLDFGIATSPWALIEKSGATAAFLDHGLPVLVTRDDWQLRTGYTPEPAGDPLLFRSSKALVRALACRAVPRDRIGEVAQALERDLAAC